MADTHYPHSYEIPRWVRPRRRRSSVPFQCNISRDPVPRIYVSAKRLLPIPLYPRPPPTLALYPTLPEPVSPFPLPLSIVIMETIILLSPSSSSVRLRSPSPSPFLHLSHHLTDNPPHRTESSPFCHFRLCYFTVCVTFRLCRSTSAFMADFSVMPRSIVAPIGSATCLRCGECFGTMAKATSGRRWC